MWLLRLMMWKLGTGQQYFQELKANKDLALDNDNNNGLQYHLIIYSKIIYGTINTNTLIILQIH